MWRLDHDCSQFLPLSSGVLGPSYDARRVIALTELTILMPCLNEAETLAACIKTASNFLERSGIDGEVLIADNGSSDGSQDIARGLGARVVHVPQRGYGAALGAGIKAAHGRYVIMGDCDESYDFGNLEPFVEALRGGSELVMGNRFRGGIAPGAMPALHYYFGNPVLSGVGRLFFRSKVGDFHCGLRGFSREAILRLNLTTPGMEFASEMVIQATLRGLKITEVPTTLSPDGRSRPPHLRSFRDGWRHLKLLLTYAPKWLFLYPGLALLLIGSVIYAALLGGPVTLGTLTFDTATLILASALILVGFQMSCMFALARQHAHAAGLMPLTPRFARLRAELTVDRCCQVGGLFLLASLISIGLAFAMWGQSGWGDLSASRIARPTSFAVITAALGVQSLASGFLWGFLAERKDVAEDALSETDPHAIPVGNSDLA